MERRVSSDVLANRFVATEVRDGILQNYRFLIPSLLFRLPSNESMQYDYTKIGQVYNTFLRTYNIRQDDLYSPEPIIAELKKLTKEGSLPSPAYVATVMAGYLRFHPNNYIDERDQRDILSHALSGAAGRVMQYRETVARLTDLSRKRSQVFEQMMEMRDRGERPGRGLEMRHEEEDLAIRDFLSNKKNDDPIFYPWEDFTVEIGEGEPYDYVREMGPRSRMRFYTDDEMIDLASLMRYEALSLRSPLRAEAIQKMHPSWFRRQSRKQRKEIDDLQSWLRGADTIALFRNVCGHELAGPTIVLQTGQAGAGTTEMQIFDNQE